MTSLHIGEGAVVVMLSTPPHRCVLQASRVEVRMAIPETSTMLFVVQELSNRLKLVDRVGHIQPNNPFRLHDELLDGGQEQGKL